MEYTPKRFHCPACGFEPAENVSEKEYAHCAKKQNDRIFEHMRSLFSSF